MFTGWLGPLILFKALTGFLMNSISVLLNQFKSFSDAVVNVVGDCDDFTSANEVIPFHNELVKRRRMGLNDCQDLTSYEVLFKSCALSSTL